jgi:L-lysine 2,3-aminomutase
VLDIPGGHGKSPLTAGYADRSLKGDYALTDYQGAVHPYRER